MIVDLERWEYEWANQVGIRRFTENWERHDASHYDRSRMEDDRTAQVAATVCELAVAKLTNQYWSGHVWPASDHASYRDLADVGMNIEVRRLRSSDAAAVRQWQVGKGLVLFVARPAMPELRAVDVLGWVNYDDAWAVGQPSHYDPEKTRTVSGEHLHCPSLYHSYS